MNERSKERTYSDEEIKARLAANCRIGIWKAAGFAANTGRTAGRER